MSLSESRLHCFTTSPSHFITSILNQWWMNNSGGLEKCGGEEWWWWSGWWRVAWGGGVGGGDVKAADLTAAATELALESEATDRAMLAMRRKWTLREVKVTSLGGTFTSFFLSFILSFSLTHTLCCCACWMCMHEEWMDESKQASKQARKHSHILTCITHSHSFIHWNEFTHIHSSYVFLCFEYMLN